MRALLAGSVLWVTAVGLSGQNATGAWKLSWSDEFNGAANSPPDPSKWNHDLGGGGWGNGEQET